MRPIWRRRSPVCEVEQLPARVAAQRQRAAVVGELHVAHAEGVRQLPAGRHDASLAVVDRHERERRRRVEAEAAISCPVRLVASTGSSPRTRWASSDHLLPGGRVDQRAAVVAQRQDAVADRDPPAAAARDAPHAAGPVDHRAGELAVAMAPWSLTTVGPRPIPLPTRRAVRLEPVTVSTTTIGWPSGSNRVDVARNRPDGDTLDGAGRCAEGDLPRRPGRRPGRRCPARRCRCPSAARPAARRVPAAAGGGDRRSAGSGRSRHPFASPSRWSPSRPTRSARSSAWQCRRRPSRAAVGASSSPMPAASAAPPTIEHGDRCDRQGGSQASHASSFASASNAASGASRPASRITMPLATTTAT